MENKDLTLQDIFHTCLKCGGRAYEIKEEETSITTYGCVDQTECKFIWRVINCVE